jgi:hypothetical protein
MVLRVLAMEEKADFAYWATRTTWKAHEAVSLFLGLDPNFIWHNGNVSYRAGQYKVEVLRLLAAAIDATNHKQLGYPYTPARWLAWAKKCNLPVPPALEAEIDQWSGVSGSPGSAARGRITEPETRIAELAGKTDGRLSSVEGSPPALPMSNANVAKRCEDWLKSEMEKSPQFRPKQKSEFKENAQKSFEGLREREFKQAWKNAIKSTAATAWSAPGAPRKSIQKSCQKS